MNAVNDNSTIDGFDGPRASTVQVLGLLVSTAFALSYLGAYAFTNTLLDAGLIQPWGSADPRPRWLALCFVSLLAVFGAAGVFFRLMSSRQLRSIDALADETEEFRINDT
jgi:hypothetical protein